MESQSTPPQPPTQSNKKMKKQPAQLYDCIKCNIAQPRSNFSKKSFASERKKCHLCTRTEKAELWNCKDKVSTNTSATSKKGNISASGMYRRVNNHGYCDYVDQVMGLRCYADIVLLKVFSTAKDISESVAAIRGVEQYLAKSNEVLCLCIGDGNTPRTAVLAAFWKQWTCVSIDPLLKEEWVGETAKGVRGLTGYQGTLEEYLDSLPPQVIEEQSAAILPLDSAICQPVSTTQITDANNLPEEKKKTLVLLCVHSHVQFRDKASLQRVRALHPACDAMILVSIPCCPGFRHVDDVGRNPDKTYDDDCVFSACRAVNIWYFD